MQNQHGCPLPDLFSSPFSSVCLQYCILLTIFPPVFLETPYFSGSSTPPFWPLQFFHSLITLDISLRLSRCPRLSLLDLLSPALVQRVWGALDMQRQITHPLTSRDPQSHRGRWMWEQRARSLMSSLCFDRVGCGFSGGRTQWRGKGRIDTP